MKNMLLMITEYNKIWVITNPARIAMINPESVLKSRDITLLTKLYLVKAMVFPLVMYRCESWTIKKVGCQRIDALNCGAREGFWESLICKEIKSANPKGNQPEYSLEGLMLKLQYFGHAMWRADSSEKTLMLGKTEGRRRRRWQRMRPRWLDGSVDVSFSKVRETVKESIVLCSSWGCKQ